MSSSTQNLNLTKPSTDEYFNLSILNDNWQKIDNGWGTLNSSKYALTTSATNVPENADLDDYNTPGVYTVGSASRAASLSHCPYTASGSRLEVMGQNSNTVYLRQFLYPAGDVFFFTRVKGPSAWGNWYKFTGTVQS